MRERIKIDCHVHSRFSVKDSVAPVWQIEEERQRKALDCVAVVDHDTIAETARDLKETSGFPFILGEEILTSDKNSRGKRIEIIGLFLQEPIEAGKTIEETIYRIDAQKGIVVIPHPFEEWRHGAGGPVSRVIITKCQEDRIPVAVEVFNARAGKNDNFLAEVLWLEFKTNGVLATAGSDAHRIPEIGRGCVEIPPFQTKEEFLEALTQARIHGEINSLGTVYHRLMNRIEVAIGSSFQDLGKLVLEQVSNGSR